MRPESRRERERTVTVSLLGTGPEPSKLRRRARQDHRRTLLHGYVIPDESRRLRCRAIWLEIMRPAESDGLIPELGLHPQAPCRTRGADGIADPVTAPREIGIVQSPADHRGVPARRALVEAARQQTIVFQIADAGEQARGDASLQVAEDILVDLDLVRRRDFVIVGLETRRIGIVVVAG